MPLPTPRVLRFVIRILRDFFFENHGLILSGAVAYNMMLSLIPLSAIMLVVFSHFFDERLLMESLTNEMTLIAPGFVSTLEEVLRGFLRNRQVVGWIGGGVLLFFSSMAFRVLEDAIAMIFHRPLPTLRRKFWVSALMPYLFILFVSLALIVITAINALIDTQGLIFQSFPQVLDLVKDHFGRIIYLSGVLALVVIFTLFYKIMPVARVSFPRALVGGVTATILWEITRHLLVYYYSNISMVNVVYGSMATLIIVLLTMEAIALILLLGAQIIADLQANSNAGIPWHADPQESLDAEM